MVETEKINNFLTNIESKNISAGGGLICENTRASLKNTNRYSIPGWRIRLETQIRNLRQQTKMILNSILLDDLIAFNSIQTVYNFFMPRSLEITSIVHFILSFKVFVSYEFLNAVT